MRIDILTLFPDMFAGVLGESILRIAQEKGLLEVALHNIRDYTENKHGKVDDKPFGGGPGMVMCCQPVVDAVSAVRAQAEPPGRLIFLSPAGRRFDQELARELSGEKRLLLVCGRYEGFDQRLFDILRPEVISIGDYVLSGGEVAALVVVEAVTLLLPGVLGSAESLEDESFTAGRLDYPHYTQPANFRGHEAPEVLRGGNHELVAKWRREQARARTERLRPDLLREGEPL